MKCRIYKCKASCCHNLPLPVGILQHFADKIVTPVIATERLPFNPKFPLSDFVYTSFDPADNKCPFLRADYKCNIYEDRPLICRKFGDGSEPMLTCKFRK